MMTVRGGVAAGGWSVPLRDYLRCSLSKVVDSVLAEESRGVAKSPEEK